jgi:hypothetical protein
MKMRRVVVVMAGAVSVIGAAWFSGMPQRALLERVVSGELGVPVSAKGIGVFSGLSVGNLAVFHEEGSGKAVAELQGVTVDYEVFPDDGRMVSVLRVETLRVFADASNSEAPNFRFLVDYFTNQDPSDDVRWLPKRIEIASIEFEGLHREVRADLGGVSLVVELRNKDDVDIVLSGTSIRGSLFGLADESEIASMGLDGANVLLEAQVRGDVVYADLHVALSQGPEFDAQYELDDAGRYLQIDFASWKKSELMEVVPEMFRAGIGDVEFDELSGRSKFIWGDTMFVVESVIHSTSETNEDAISIDIALNGTFDRIAETEGTALIRVGQGNIRATGARGPDGGYAGNVEIDNVRMKPLVFLTTGNALPEEVSGRINGSVRIRELENGERLEISPELNLTDLMYDGVEIESVALSGSLTIESDGQTGTIRDVLILTEDERLRIGMASAKLNLETGDLLGELRYLCDLELVTEVLEHEGLYGTIEGTGSLEIVDGKYRMPFSLTSGDIGYENIAPPYGQVFSVAGTLEMNWDASVFTSDELRVGIGEGTQIIFADAMVDSTGLTAKSKFASDLVLGADMGYYNSAEGQLTGSVDWKLPKGGDLAFTWDTAGRVEQLVLKDEAGTVSGMEFSASGEYSGGLQGSGEVSIETITVAGAKLESTLGAVAFVDDALVVHEAMSRVFEGELISTVEVKLLEEGVPITYAGRLENIDLALMTEQVQPPKTELTGIASGTLSAGYGLSGGLTVFELDLASDENFSINRSLVEEMMQMQNVLGGLAEKKAAKTIAKFLGTETQRPFDTATMNLYLLDDVILGVTEMRSVKTKAYNGLNLTIQLDIDQPALVSSLKLLEESNIGNVSF